MKNKQVAILCIGGLMFGLVAMTSLAAIAKFTYVHPEGQIFEVTNEGAVVLPGFQQPPPVDVASRARAVVDEDDHDFGVMDPLTMGHHVFTVRNEGNAPLKLTQGYTSCKCTLSEVANGELAPGEVGTVRLEWNTGRDPEFFHHAEVDTNDPMTPKLVLKVHGNVRMGIGVDSEGITFPDIDPDKPVEATTLLYSQIWDRLTFVGGTASRDEIEWRIEPASREQVEAREAKCAYQLTVILPAGLPRGLVRESLSLHVRPSDATSDVETVEVPLQGEVLGRLAVLGREVNARGELDLGVLKRGHGTKKRLLLKIRDEEKALELRSVESEPDFLQVHVTPFKPEKGISNLVVEVPADAPTCSYRGVSLGSLSVNFDHPRVERLRLRVNLAIID